MPIRSLATLFLLVTALATLPGNACARILPNGDFDKGKEGWGLSQQEMARAEFSVVPADSPNGGNAARIRVEVNGPAHRLQLSQSFPNQRLVPGKGYVLLFWARATQPTTLQILLMNRNKPWENLGVRRTLSLNTQWKQYRYVFRGRSSTQPVGKVNFFLGRSQGTVWLDGVAIEPYDPKAVEPDGPILQTDDWRLQFFKNGAIGRLVHKPTGRVLIQPSADRRAYELTLDKSGMRQTITSDQATADKAERFDDGLGIRFVARHPGLTVTLSYQVDQQTGLLACRGTVKNSSDAAVTRMTFPIINAPAQLGDRSDDDVLLYPAFDGMVIDDPRQTFRDNAGDLSGDYPGPLSCQVMAYCDPAAGLYMATRDPDGYPKQFTVTPGFQIQFSISHMAPAVAGEDMAPTYPVIIGPFTGDARRGGTSWYDAANIYRTWAACQSWAQRKVRDRRDTPEWLRRGALVTLYNPRQMTPPGDQSKLEAFLKDYRNRFQIPVLPNNRGYERYGTWCAQQYRPVMPDEATFRGSAQVARSLGGQSMIMLSGYRWTIQQRTPEGALYDGQQLFDREVAPWAVHGPDGKPVIQTSTKKSDFHGQKWSRLCRATEYAKNSIVDFSKYCVRNGYSVIHFDQEVSGAYAASVCWSKDHGHPPGDGRWIHLAMADLYARICAACRPLDPDFALSMEEPNELYLPWLNMCQERPFGITNEWPVVRPGTRSVPLFMYLYHENLIGWAAFYPWKSGGHPCYVLAKGFTVGQMPGLVPPQGLRGMNAAQQARFMTLMQRCVTGYRTFAHDYLVWGRMQRPLTLAIPARRFKVTRGGAKQPDIVVPAVAHEVWTLDDGRIGVVMVNPQPTAVRLPMDLTPLLGGRTVVAVQEISTSGGRRTHETPRFELDVPALDMVLLEISGLNHHPRPR